MYGKIFSDMYEGSMAGAGPSVFALWAYCIAKANPESHTVRLNPITVLPSIGDTQQNFDFALNYLCSPDINTTNKEADHGKG